MLLSALYDPNVKNIAIAGAYGSGKSSIIKTFLKRNPYYRSKTVNISLASFCVDNEHDMDGNENRDNSNILQRQLELSILQQLIYHTPPNEIPYSRFRRIWNIAKRTIVFNVLAGCIVLMGGLSFINSDLYSAYVSNYNLLWPVLSIQIISFILIIIFISWIVRFCSRLSWLKINIPNVELEISHADASSILNRHMDEIIYYFESGAFDTVIFEDLDRFDSVLIFQKLREINLILNNARQIGHRIVFIYALRDDVFKDESRTKFFDYMIPVVPIVNISNSGDKLIDFFVRHKEISPIPSKDFLSEVSIFIDSMRLLVGICNEYVLYHKVLNDGKLIPEKLFGMIVYKNLYPDDFVLLHNNSGILASILSEKSAYIKEKDTCLSKELTDLNNKLALAEQTWIKNKTELRLLYLSFIANEYADQCIEISLDNRYPLWNCTEDSLWQQLYSAKPLYLHLYSRYRNQDENIAFSEIEDKNGKYSEREKIIERTHEQNKKEIENRIVELKKQKAKLKTITVAELISNQAIPLKQENSKLKSLIGFLLGNGYIDENYHTYISFFHEGSLTSVDNEFVMSVIGKNPVSWNYQLANTKNIIDRLQIQYFDKSYILNFDLLTKLLITDNDKWVEKRNAMIQLLAKLDMESRKFIDAYIDHPNSRPEKLFGIITRSRQDFWEIIEAQADLPFSRKDKYLAILFDGCHDQLQALNKTGSLKTYFTQMDHVFSFIDVHNNPDACINAIEKLEIQFENLDLPETQSALRVFDYIYRTNAYALNTQVLKVVLQVKMGKEFNSIDFQEANYSYVKKSMLPELLDYIDNNWPEYFNNVILGNCKQSDDQSIITTILNNSNISLEIRILYLSCQKTPLADLHLISENEVKNAIIKNNLMKSNWHNIFSYFISSTLELTSEMSAYLNRIDVYSVLGEEQLIYQGDILTEKNAEKIFPIIMKADTISENAVQELQKASSFRWRTFGLGVLPAKRIETLLLRNNFSLSRENYTELKAKLPNSQIRLVEQNASSFLSVYPSLPIEKNDWSLILKSRLKDEIKEEIIKREYEQLLPIHSCIVAIRPIVENSYRKHWHVDIIVACLPFMTNDIALKIGLFHLRTRNFDKSESRKIIKSLPLPYCKLAQPSAKPCLPNDSCSKFLLKYIEDWDIISTVNDTDKKTIKVTMRTKKQFDLLK